MIETLWTRKGLSLFFSLSLLFVILSNGKSFATTIVLIKTPNEIVVGADSKPFYKTNWIRYDSVCKIRSVGAYFYAASGWVHSSDRSYDSYAIAAEEAATNKTLKEIARSFAQRTVNVLQARMPQVLTYNPKAFQTLMQEHILETIFFGVENNSLVAIDVTIDGKLENNEIVVTATILDDFYFDVIGEKKIAAALENTEGFWSKGLIAGVRRLVQSEIDAEPDDVGPPIDIIRVTTKGAMWIQKKSICARKQRVIQNRNHPLRPKED